MNSQVILDSSASCTKVQGLRRPYGKPANKMTQIEYYKRYSEDECKKMSDEEYNKAAKYLQALKQEKD